MKNKVNVVHNFLNIEECNLLISSMSQINDKSSFVANNLRKILVNPEFEEVKPILNKALLEIKKITNTEDLFITEFLLSSYLPGYSMGVHTDLEDGKEHFAISAVVYLNDNFKGGDIVFPLLNFKHAPNLGDLAWFFSDDPECIHGVEKVTSGIRYVMPIWITNNSAKALKFLHN